jgi:hypothetical protein
MKLTPVEIAVGIGLLFPALLILMWMYLVRSEMKESADAKKKLD